MQNIEMSLNGRRDKIEKSGVQIFVLRPKSSRNTVFQANIFHEKFPTSFLREDGMGGVGL